jgi:hypothetical protein
MSTGDFCETCGLALGESGRCESPDCASNGATPGDPGPRPVAPETVAVGWSGAPGTPPPPGPGDVNPARIGRRVNFGDPVSTRDLVVQLQEHRRQGWGKLIVLAGHPRHGKSKLAEWLAADARTRPGAKWDYEKTISDQVEVYTVPEVDGDQILLDMAGEDFRQAGDYAGQLPGLIQNFLWPLFPDIEALVLVISLPILWRAWNQAAAPGEPGPPRPTPTQIADMQRAYQQMVEAHRLVLKYAKVAHDLKRLEGRKGRVKVSREQAPSRDDVDALFKAARPLPIPVFVAFSKADLFRTVDHPDGLYAPPLPDDRRLGQLAGRPSPPINPCASDPLVLGWAHFPGLFEFLREHVRHFKFDFVQVLKDPNERPNPEFATGEPIYEADELLGARGAMEFLTCDMWTRPSVSSAAAIRWSRILNPGRWNVEGATAALQGHDADGAQ